MRILLPVVAALVAASSCEAQSARDCVYALLIALAKRFELKTPYVPPPGRALVHDASGFAKTMCSAVFITGLNLDFAAENVGWFTAPYESRARLGKPVVD